VSDIAQTSKNRQRLAKTGKTLGQLKLYLTFALRNQLPRRYEVSHKKFFSAILLVVLIGSVVAAQTKEWDASSVAKAAIERGNRSFAKADYESALREYRSVPRIDRDTYAQALYNIGVCYYELWRTDEAINFYRRALTEQHGRYPRASYALGVALENQNRLIEAKEAYRQSIIASEGEYGPALYRLGLLTSIEGDYEAAAACYRKAIGRVGAHVPASHNNLGVMLAHQGRLIEAGREFEIALKQTNGDFDVAAQNLKLCRSLLAAPMTAQIAALKIAIMSAVALK
jgi:tetratricopeptide (TPR) repeat protein